MKEGKVKEIIGVVIDVEFKGDLPAIYDALIITGDTTVTLEVAQHLDENTVRAIALSSTDGLKRGQEVEATGAPISVPVGDETQGRMFNVTGDPIDGQPAPKGALSPIHRPAPSLDEQSNKTEVLETGIKVVDLIAPLIKGGKAGLFATFRHSPLRLLGNDRRADPSQHDASYLRRNRRRLD